MQDEEKERKAMNLKDRPDLATVMFLLLLTVVFVACSVLSQGSYQKVKEMREEIFSDVPKAVEIESVDTPAAGTNSIPALNISINENAVYINGGILLEEEGYSCYVPVPTDTNQIGKVNKKVYVNNIQYQLANAAGEEYPSGVTQIEINENEKGLVMSKDFGDIRLIGVWEGPADDVDKVKVELLNVCQKAILISDQNIPISINGHLISQKGINVKSLSGRTIVLSGSSDKEILIKSNNSEIDTNLMKESYSVTEEVELKYNSGIKDEETGNLLFLCTYFDTDDFFILGDSPETVKGFFTGG